MEVLLHRCSHAIKVAPSYCCRWTRTSSFPPLHPPPPPTPTCVMNLEDICSLINMYSGAPKDGRVNPALLLLGTQGISHGASSLLLFSAATKIRYRPSSIRFATLACPDALLLGRFLHCSLLLGDLGYGRDGRHQATAACRGSSSATPTTHELQARHAFKDYLSQSGSRPRTRSDLKPMTRKSRGAGA